jgi:tRNA pseudouridine55 synthase
MLGILNINKLAGMTSRRVVDRVQYHVYPDKVGHAGTLDPLATGVLILCVGSATRLIEYVQRMPKRYRGTFLLGRHSDTEDVEGEVELLDSPPVPTREQIEAALQQFRGEIQQRPPAFSALKVAGKRAYQLARAGKEVDLKPRPVQIDSLEIISYEYPSLVLDVRCGSGTYVRSLGRDLAESLGTAAVMSALERTEIGDFKVEDAAEMKQLGNPEAIQQQLQPVALAVSMLPQLVLDEGEIFKLANGLNIVLPAMEVVPKEMAVMDCQGKLASIIRQREGNVWRPVRNFARP